LRIFCSRPYALLVRETINPRRAFSWPFSPSNRMRTSSLRLPCVEKLAVRCLVMAYMAGAVSTAVILMASAEADFGLRHVPLGLPWH
jgi:hypothetical protein